MQVLNLDRFFRALDRAAADVDRMALLFQKRVALEALERVVAKTPVDTGRARQSWQVRRNATSEADVGEWQQRDSVVEGQGVILALKEPYGIVHIFSNVEYIEFLENGSSQQAPEGMVALTVRELEAGLTQLDAGLRFEER